MKGSKLLKASVFALFCLFPAIAIADTDIEELLVGSWDFHWGFDIFTDTSGLIQVEENGGTRPIHMIFHETKIGEWYGPETGVTKTFVWSAEWSEDRNYFHLRTAFPEWRMEYVLKPLSNGVIIFVASEVGHEDEAWVGTLTRRKQP